MTRSALLLLAGLCLATAPAAAQDWGSGYNMGSIGVTGGNAATGEIMIDCAESGNPVVPQGSLTVFLKPAEGASASAGDFTLGIDGSEIVLPFGADQGDGFVYEKSAATLDGATALIAQLKTGKTLTVTAGGAEIAAIDLGGAAAALDGVEVCLVP